MQNVAVFEFEYFIRIAATKKNKSSADEVIATSNMIDHNASDPTKVILQHCRFEDKTIENLLLVQVLEAGDSILSRIVPEFNVVQKKPQLEVTARLVLSQQTQLDENEMAALREVDKWATKLAYPLLLDDHDAGKSLFLVPKIIEPSQTDLIRNNIKTFTHLLNTARSGPKFIDKINETASKYTNQDINDLGYIMQAYIGQPEQEIQQKLESDVSFKSALESAEKIEKELVGTFVIASDLQVYNYSKGPVQAKADYMCMKGAITKRNWVKKKTSAVRFHLLKGMTRSERKTTIEEMKLYETDKNPMHLRVYSGLFLPITQETDLRIFTCDYDFFYQIVHLRPTVQYLENQLRHDRLVHSTLYESNHFSDPLLLRTALTHTIYMEQHQRKHTCNQHLELMGDAVLELCMAEYIYEQINQLGPESIEYNWSEIMRILVSNKYINNVSLRMKLDQLLLFGVDRSPITLGKIMGDTLEAIIGAIFLDTHYSNAKDFVYKYCIPDASSWNILLHENIYPQDYIEYLRQVPACRHADIDIPHYENHIKHVFQDKSLLIKALSGHNIGKGVKGSHIAPDGNLPCGCNGRLKLIGTSLLRLIVTEHVFKTSPIIEEGSLSLSVHAAMHRGDVCMKTAIMLTNVADYMCVTGSDVQQPNLIDLGNATLALFGAVFVDGGSKLFRFVDNTASSTLVPDYLKPYVSVRHDVSNFMIHDVILKTFDATDRILPTNINKPAKNMLQNQCQVMFNHVLPKFTYDVGDGNITVTIKINDMVIGVGNGYPQWNADAAAVKEALTYCEELKLRKLLLK
ncbi:hypothetical protein AKO1_009319 [Acrasis kona]|uniref:RNase III domain-containing protein n=1 Tax=Acrasis kona TaxID=1008807 RepID=A0AAW2ZJE0_9EUKA